MGWIQTAWHYKTPAVRLTLDRETAFRERWDRFLHDDAPDPEAVAAQATRVILRHRPELAGLIVVGVNFDFAWGRWEFVVVHPSLPRVPFGEVLPDMPVVPEAAEPAVVEAKP